MRSLVGLVVVVAIAATVGACTGAVVSATAGWVIGPLIAVTMLPVVMRKPAPVEPGGRSGGASPAADGSGVGVFGRDEARGGAVRGGEDGGGASRHVLPGDAEPEWAADRLDDEPRPGDWDGRPGP